MVYAFVLKGLYFFYPYTTNLYPDSIAGKWLSEEIHNLPFWFIHIVAILLTYWQAIRINIIFDQYRINEKPTFIPAMIFITLSSILPELVFLNTLMIAYLFVIPFVRNMLSIPEQERAVESFFFTGFYLGIASLFYHPLIFLLAVIIMALLVLKRPHWRELIISIIGFIIPYYFLGVYFFLTDQFASYISFVTGHFDIQGIGLAEANSLYIFIGAIILFIAGIGYLQAMNKSRQGMLLFRKYYNVFAFYIIAGIITFFLVKNNSVVFAYSFLIPISLFVSKIFEKEKTTVFQYAVYLSFLVMIAYFQWEYVFFLK